MSLAALGLLFGWLALAVGAAIPSRALAIGVPAGIVAGAYLVNGLHGLAGWPVGSSPLQQGADAWGVLVVILAALVVLLAGSLLVERRDLETP